MLENLTLCVIVLYYDKFNLRFIIVVIFNELFEFFISYRF